jgi:ferrous iron transport protein B
LASSLKNLVGSMDKTFASLPQKEWVALRLLEGDSTIRDALEAGELVEGEWDAQLRQSARDLIDEADSYRWGLPQNINDLLTESIYAEAAEVASRNIRRPGESGRLTWQQQLDWLLTSKWTGFPAMFLIFATILWMTIEGANVPSGMLADLLIGTIYPLLHQGADALGLHPWVAGLTIDGMYLGCAWVVSVMLPPMAIFFPLFTILEDFGYLPRVAFNLDRLFQKVGAHGKQALTMSMGLGCNAAGVIACRIIDSPRERLIAIITNNFSLCNGRWPTQILVATIFLGALVPTQFSGLAAAAGVIGVATLGFGFAFFTSWLLSQTLLRGESSTFSLELPSYRPPSILRTLYTSLIDRTLFVLWRAVVFALPAGAAIWLSANIPVGEQSLAHWLIYGLDPVAQVMGLTGVILLAYIVAIPANEIVIPTILMLTVLQAGLSGMGAGAGVMFETDELASLEAILRAGGWTTLTAICLMLFSLLHNPCSTTIYTIYKETRSWKWTGVATFLPIVFGVIACVLVACVWRLLF